MEGDDGEKSMVRRFVKSTRQEKWRRRKQNQTNTPREFRLQKKEKKIRAALHAGRRKKDFFDALSKENIPNEEASRKILKEAPICDHSRNSRKEPPRNLEKFTTSRNLSIKQKQS